jgi:hypothetical protein
VDGTLRLNETRAWYTDLAHTTKAVALPGASSDVVLLTLPAAGPAAPRTIASFDCTAVDADVPSTLTANLTVTGAVVSGHAARTHDINGSPMGSLTMNVAGTNTGTVSGGAATFNGATIPSGSADLSAASKVVWNSTGTPGATSWPALVEAHKAIDLTGAAQAYAAPTVIKSMALSASALIGNAGDTGTVRVEIGIAAADIRSGVGGGTCAVPAANVVKFGESVDATTGTYPTTETTQAADAALLDAEKDHLQRPADGGPVSVLGIVGTLNTAALEAAAAAAQLVTDQAAVTLVKARIMASTTLLTVAGTLPLADVRDGAPAGSALPRGTLKAGRVVSA